MKIKKSFILLVVFICLLLTCSIAVFADGDLHWYLKRNKGKAPSFPPEAEQIKEYNAYYLDKNANSAGNKVIYLTFDAGYENGNVEKILNILKEESVPGAFFLLDNIIIKNPELIKRMFDEGHIVCNHTKNHKNLSRSSAEEIQRNLLSLEKICEEKVGMEMRKYFRFPEGCYSIDALRKIDALGYKTIFWSFAYDDWDNGRQPSNKNAIQKILDNTHPGAVMLFHPTSATNAEIFKDLIIKWKEMGYKFGTLDELTCK